MYSQIYPALFLLALTILIQHILAPRRRKLRHVPPGPKPLPVVGNLFDVPPEKAWLKYAEWKKQYGDITYLNVLGTRMLVLNSLKACNDLLDKRSSIYSDRVRMIMTTELAGWNFNFALMGYSSRWRRHRRVFHQYFNEGATLDHRPVQEADTHKLLHDLLRSPGKFLEHIRFSFGRTILKVGYDIDVKNPDHPYITNAETALGPILTSSSPGKFIVDFLPFLKHIPAWMPGAGFKRQAQEWSKIILAMRDLPFAEFQEKVTRGTARPSVLSSILSRYRDESIPEGANTLKSESMEEVAKGSISTAYAGGADTSVVSIQTLFLAMANYPHVQKMAQAELDAVVGQDRLPTFSDIKSLPYISAIIKELLRWHTIAPLAVPHRSTEDDEYEGYFIPKGTIVIPNSWLLLHDPEVYSEPNVFNPSRWLLEGENGLQLNSAVPEPSAAFGYGRRACAGKHFADNSLFINVSNILASFNISPLDESGQPAECVKEEFTDGIISQPKPFKVSITPRSEKVARLINEAVACAD